MEIPGFDKIGYSYVCQSPEDSRLVCGNFNRPAAALKDIATSTGNSPESLFASLENPKTELYTAAHVNQPIDTASKYFGFMVVVPEGDTLQAQWAECAPDTSVAHRLYTFSTFIRILLGRQQQSQRYKRVQVWARSGSPLETVVIESKQFWAHGRTDRSAESLVVFEHAPMQTLSLKDMCVATSLVLVTRVHDSIPEFREHPFDLATKYKKIHADAQLLGVHHVGENYDAWSISYQRDFVTLAGERTGAPHYYCWLIGVVPEARRRHYATRLVRHFVATAHCLGLPAWVRTHSESGLPALLEREGFERRDAAVDAATGRTRYDYIKSN